MLLEIGISDAYGQGFEYIDQGIVDKYNDLTKFLQHPRHNISPGTYTDDTQMSIAVTEWIIDGNFDKLALANKFVECFKRDWRDGYARGFQAFLESINSGDEFLEKIISTSDKSGGAMRAGPCGIFKTIKDVMEISRLQASLTHNTYDGIQAAQAASLMVYYFVNNIGPKEDLGKWLYDYVKVVDWRNLWHGKVKSKGWMSVWAACTAIMLGENLCDIIKKCVAFGGDTDTTAAIAAAAASNIFNDIPLTLIDKFEINSSYGKDFLVALDKKLFEYKLSL